LSILHSENDCVNTIRCCCFYCRG